MIYSALSDHSKPRLSSLMLGKDALLSDCCSPSLLPVGSPSTSQAVPHKLLSCKAHILQPVTEFAQCPSGQMQHRRHSGADKIIWYVSVYDSNRRVVILALQKWYAAYPYATCNHQQSELYNVITRIPHVNILRQHRDPRNCLSSPVCDFRIDK